MFEPVRSISLSILECEFAEFKRTPEYTALNEMLNKSVVEDKREISEFELSSNQLFLIKVKGSKKSREVRLEKKKNVLTIGRDKSNMLVIEDSRVSRSHARVEYTETRKDTAARHRRARARFIILTPRSSRSFYYDSVCFFSLCTECEYIDLGSSCGSKLNGKPVLRAKLRPGDVIELGQSVLIFQVKRKKSMKENIQAFLSNAM